MQDILLYSIESGSRPPTCGCGWPWDREWSVHRLDPSVPCGFVMTLRSASWADADMQLAEYLESCRDGVARAAGHPV